MMAGLKDYGKKVTSYYFPAVRFLESINLSPARRIAQKILDPKSDAVRNERRFHMTNPKITYDNIFTPNSSVTGIRRDCGKDAPILITGSHEPNSGKQPQGLLYRGPLYPTDSSGYIFLTPNFPGQTVTTSIFYGPNTSLFDPEIGEGNLRAVGSYKYSEGGHGDHGMMYQGSPDGSGTWTQINVPERLAGGTVANTIPHSTMGDLVVGNYDLAGKPGSGNAFIYNMRTGMYQVLDIGPLATAYGIWQNDGAGSSLYTIAGGYKRHRGINAGFLLDYDAKKGAIGHPTPFSYDNKPGFLTHFEGITAFGSGYSLAATTEHGAAFAIIEKNSDGSYGEPAWVPIANPCSTGISTGNSVLDNHLIGIYKAPEGGIQSYIATVSP
jgi:hypothetical protein